MHKSFTVAHLNVRSLFPKLIEVEELLVNYSLDALCLTETWLTQDISTEMIGIANYKFFRCDRGCRGGGVGIYVRDSISCRSLESSSNIEQVWIVANANTKNAIIGCVYRAPNFSSTVFLAEFEDQLQRCNLLSDSVFCLGDLNINMLNTECSLTLDILHACTATGMTQIISEPTRITPTSATLLDVVMVSDADIVAESGVIVSDISDHDLVFCRTNITSSRLQPKLITYRDFSSFNYNDFQRDLNAIPFHNIFHLDLDDKVKFFDAAVVSLFDIHAPLKTIKITKPRSPWITANIKFLQNLRDKAKRKYNRVKDEASLNYYKQLRNFTTLAIRNEKKAYLRYVSSISDGRRLWSELRALKIGKRQSGGIPSHLMSANDINSAFVNSVPDVLGGAAGDFSMYAAGARDGISSTFSFRPVDSVTVYKLLLSIKSRAVASDGISAAMLRLLVPHVLPYLSHLVNSCIYEGVFPESWKSSVVIPIPKKSKVLSFDDLRPISILPVMSKILEKIMYEQITEHLELYDILPPCQSGFRRNYSCTTALLRVLDDIIGARDNNYLSILILLDFTKAFDTINHVALLGVLRYIGFSSGAVGFLESYLCGRKQSVKLSFYDYSLPLSIDRGVPQGSILGPLLFSIYTCELHKYVNHSSVSMYADDTQLYKSFPINDLDSALNGLNADLESVSKFAKSHSLKLNSAKTTVLLFGSNNHVAVCGDRVNLTMDGSPLVVSPSATYLGVDIDNTFRFRLYVSKLIKNACYKLKILYPYRNLFSLGLKAKLCESLVLSIFNYASPVYGPCLDVADKARIQRIQNSCLRYVFGIRKFDRISHKLADLKWLNMNNRRRYHSLILYHKIITTGTPPYLLHKIRFRTDVHNINIRNRNLITPPRHRLSFYERSFSYSVYVAYNHVPNVFKELSLGAFRRAMYGHIYECQ